MIIFCVVFISISVWVVLHKLDKIIGLLESIKNQGGRNE